MKMPHPASWGDWGDSWDPRQPDPLLLPPAKPVNHSSRYDKVDEPLCSELEKQCR